MRPLGRREPTDWNHISKYWVTDMSGGIRGGHALCFMDASDKRQAFRTLNTWGPFYPPTWFPYALVERLLAEQGEAVVLVP